MNEVVREWLDKAEADYGTASREFEVAPNANYDAVCFHAQQCVEKLLKAVIIDRGGLPPKTHDLPRLHSLLASLGVSWPFSGDDLRFLTQAAVTYRYPGESAGREEADEALTVCRRMRTDLRGLLGADE